MARAFATRGYKIIATARRSDRLQEFAIELGDALLLIELDVTNKTEIEKALAFLLMVIITTLYRAETCH